MHMNTEHMRFCSGLCTAIGVVGSSPGIAAERTWRQQVVVGAWGQTSSGDIRGSMRRA